MPNPRTRHAPCSSCLPSLALLGLALLFFTLPAGAKPVTFVFDVTHGTLNPFLREIWAEVSMPNGSTIRLPAFYAGGSYYAVRVRPDQAGAYKLGTISEITSAHTTVPLAAKPISPTEVANAPANAALYQNLPPVGIDPKNPRRFATADGQTYFPVGGNLAWPEPGTTSPEYYRTTLKKFSTAGLNWTRIWMCHWGLQNLDWIPDYAGESPAPGVLEQRVADNWDSIVTAAEENHVYFQMVFQHHGQYSSGTNSNWKDNPWNAANKNGFLKTTGEFFSLPDARYLTRLKYRYIVARWGYSPAILAWELFNEVHWVDAMRTAEGRASVEAWHKEMAAAIRSFDPYQHLITTSNDDPRVDPNATLDYYQPHLYAPNMIDAVRTFDVPALSANSPVAKPVFYGETGDDKLAGADGDKKSSTTLLPQIWASLFGVSDEILPAQTWYTEHLVASNHIEELGSLARFALRARLAQRNDLVAFSPAVVASSAKDTTRLILRPGYEWHRQRTPAIKVTTDGSEDPSLGHIPAILVGSPDSIADGFPSKVIFHLDFPAPANAQLTIAKAGLGGATLAATLDKGTSQESILLTQSWAKTEEQKEKAANKKPAGIYSLTLPAGSHTLTLENTGGVDWLEIGALDLAQPIPKLAAFGRRANDEVVLWLWHRENIHARKAGSSVTATVLIPDLPAGRWRVTWWDAVKGKEAPGKPQTIEHSGGLLRLATIPVARHAAVILEKAD